MVEGIFAPAEGLLGRLAFAVLTVLPLAFLVCARWRLGVADCAACARAAGFELVVVFEADFFSVSVDDFLLGMDVSSVIKVYCNLLRGVEHPTCEGSGTLSHAVR